MANSPPPEIEGWILPRTVGIELDTRLSPFQGRCIVRQRLEQLANHSHLSEAGIARLSRHLTVRRYAADELIMMEGVCGDCMGLVVRGQVGIHSSGSDRRLPTVLLLPGGTFGEAMLAEGRPNDSTLRAITDVEIHFLRRADYLDEVMRRGTRSAMTTNALVRWIALVGLVLLIGSSLLLVLTPARQAVALAPYSAGLWLGQRGHADWAESLWILAQRLRSDWSAPHLSLGNLYYHRGQFDRAQTELERALVLTPDLAEAYNTLGLLFTAQDDHANAIESFRQALALEPGRATVEGNLAFSLHLTGQQDEALRRYALTHSLDELRPHLLVNEAIALYQVGDLDAAEAATRQALEQAGTSVPAHTILGAVELARQHPRAAATSLENAVLLDPEYSPAHFFLGLAYKSLDQPGLAVTAFEHALTLSTDPLAQQEARRHLSELYAHYGIDADGYQLHPAEEGR